MALYIDSPTYLHGVNAYWSTRTALFLKSSIFWDITTCRPPKIIRRFGGTCHKAPPAACFLMVSCLTHSPNPKAGAGMFFRNVGWLRTTRRYIPELQMGRGIDPCFVDLGIKWRWVVSFTPRPLYPLGKNPRYTSQRRLGETENRYRRCGVEENFLLLPGIEPRLLGRPARNHLCNDWAIPAPIIIQ
jgi:hypothetical protein